MKINSRFITIFYALLVALAIQAIKFTPLERDVKNYEKAVKVARNIPFRGNTLLDVYYNKGKDKKKVVIHIFGGSWIIGDKIGQTKIGQLLQSEGYIAVVPNYGLFPEHNIDDMVDDIYHAINWTYNNIANYGGDPKKISICAHSAGAHLTALTIVRNALKIKNKNIEFSLPPLQKVILLDGPYAFDQEFVAYTLKGMGNASGATTSPNASALEQQAALQKLMNTYFGDDSISPTALLKKQKANSVKFNIKKFIFLYASKDTVVPESSSKNLIAEISRTSRTSFKYIYEEGEGHATITDGVRDGDKNYEKKYMKIINS